MPTFIPGLELSRRFYLELVRPLLDSHFPGLPHAAALIGYGSEVLGFDSELSTDHAWCPRVLLFLPEQQAALAQPIVELCGRELPEEFLGYPLDTVEVAGEPGVFWMKSTGSRPLRHKVAPTTLRTFILETLDWDPATSLAPADWLSISSQALGTITAGAVYFDNVGELTTLRAQLAWYPREVWLYLLACGWQRIGQEQHLMPRAGYAGDETGSALIGARLVRDIMSLGFLMERHYAPYPKWFGSAFQRLSCAPQMSPHLVQALRAGTWQERETALCQACTLLAEMHNALSLTGPLPVEPESFHGRPFRVIHAERFAQALVGQIGDPEVGRIAAKGLIGSIDQFSDNTDLRSHMAWRPAIRRLYE